MANTTEELVVGAAVSINVAPQNTAEPTLVDTALNAAFKNLGFAEVGSVKFSDGKTINSIEVEQSFYSARDIVTGREFSVSFTLMQQNRDTVKLAFGGTFTDLGGGNTKWVPPNPEDVDTRVLVLLWEDGSDHYGIVVPKCSVISTVESVITRADAMRLPITMKAMAPDTGELPWYQLTDAVAFAS